MNSPRALFLIQTLALSPHPEGGHFREVFRSDRVVAPADNRPVRCALTAIYFLLKTGERSVWHRVLSDEVWVHLEGDPIALSCAKTSGDDTTWRLGRVDPAADALPIRVIPAGFWQAAAPEPGDAGYALVCCCVAPGFDFDDFEMDANREWR